VALPMDEQRILEQMERMLAADDPKLAARLAAFGQPGFGDVLRTRRARATLSLAVLVLIAAVAAVIYMMSAFRPGSGQTPRLSTNVTKIVPASPHEINLARCAATFSPACVGWPASAFARPTPKPPRASASR
jgi:Protein of unknown function (DUF3040)